MITPVNVTNPLRNLSKYLLYPNLDTIETAVFSCAVSVFSLQCQREPGADALRLCPTHVLENGK